MERSIQAGVSGFVLAVTINLFLALPPPFDFIPYFLAAIVIIYIFRLNTLKDSLVASFMTYIFSQGILSTIVAAALYLENEPYTLPIDIWLVFSQILTPITSFIAAYIGVRIVQRMKPAKESPPLPPPLPPV